MIVLTRDPVAYDGGGSSSLKYYTLKGQSVENRHCSCTQQKYVIVFRNVVRKITSS